MRRARRNGTQSPAREAGQGAPTAAARSNLAEAPAQVGAPLVLDLAKLDASGYLTPQSERRDLAEQYRVVKRPLLGRAFAEPAPGQNSPRVIQITSAVDGEGKTYTTFNLAMSIAMELDYTVMLVDADLTRRALSRMTGVVNQPGLVDVLLGERRDLGDVIFRTNVPRLCVIPAGNPHPRAAELLASDAMRSLTSELVMRYPDRVVLFDSPPLLMDAQAPTLAAHMGQVVVVVEAGRTSDKLLREAVGLLDESRARVQLLLNKSPRGYAQSYSYYGKY